MLKIIGAIILIGAVVLGVMHFRNADKVVTPTPTPTVQKTEEDIQVRLNQVGSALGIKITPLEITEDSRCPQDVQCIWAGTLKVRATLESGMGSSAQIFELNKPITTETEIIELTSVSPSKISISPISPSDYVFTFHISKRTDLNY